MSKQQKDEAKKALDQDLAEDQASADVETAEVSQTEQDPQATEQLDQESTEAELEASEPDRELAEALAQIQDLEEQKLRLAAEFDNFRKRSRREKEESYSLAKLDLVRDFLPLLDALDRAQDSYNKLEDASCKQLKEGMDLLVRQGQDCLSKLGVSEIPTEGAQFDPNLHEAVQHLEDEQYGENVIVDCLLKGYQADDKVIRHSLVRVAN